MEKHFAKQTLLFMQNMLDTFCKVYYTISAKQTLQLNFLLKEIFTMYIAAIAAIFLLLTSAVLIKKRNDNKKNDIENEN